MTVNVCHAAVTAHTTHEQLYVAATRGGRANHLWVATDTDRDVLRDADDLPDMGLLGTLYLTMAGYAIDSHPVAYTLTDEATLVVERRALRARRFAAVRAVERFTDLGACAAGHTVLACCCRALVPGRHRRH